MDEKVGSEEKDRALAFLNTEHAALQSARLAAVIEGTGRLTDLLSAVSAVVIALAFIGQVSKFGTAFYMFALSLLPILTILGVFTFLRTLQCRIEDSFYALAINRIRHYYVEVAPHASRYLLLSPHDDMDHVLSSGLHSSLLMPLLTISGSVAFINSALFATSASLSLDLVFDISIFVSVGAGAACFVLTLALHHLYQWHRWHATHEAYQPEFPGHPTDISRK